MKPTIYELVRGKGFLGIMGRPVAEWLADEISALRDAGVRVLVSLLTDEEAHELGLHGESDVCQSLGVDFISLPIPDRGIPENVRVVSVLAEHLRRRMHEGNGVIVHCRAGIGRSSVIAAAVLLHEGYTPDEAFSLISRARRVECPDTSEQASWVAGNAAQLLSSSAS